ncbi:ComF family protein [Niabella insulamsoli]|uniref:ComF family protein n=1 Tax=Niabella insulamsoli TaxID=3144874 RepID=UPI0031FE18CB
MSIITVLKDALLHIFYPHICAGCGSDILPATSQLCVSCIHQLPITGFENQPDNPIEKKLTGRIAFGKATAQLYFDKLAPIQQMMHAFKYRGNKELGHQLGLIMGNQLFQSNRFRYMEALIPLPLHENKQRKRGYNQAAILCHGIAEILKIPVLTDVVTRSEATDSQTKKNAIERWDNMKGKFVLNDATSIENKQVLLVDDVITTGATLEACANALAAAAGVGIHIATLCCASKI